MEERDKWSTTIAALIKLNINQMAIPENQKEARKEFLDATKELFINYDEKKASAHFAKLIQHLLSND